MEGRECADPVVRTLISASGIQFSVILTIFYFDLQTVMKELFKAAKLKSCQSIVVHILFTKLSVTLVLDLGPWISSISNQIWWCFSSSVGNLELLREKLNSVPDHLCNIHYFPENIHFKQCGHAPLSPDEERGKAWLSPESLVNIYRVK